MSKIRIVGLSSNMQNILDALHKTGLVQLSETTSFAAVLPFDVSSEKDNIALKYKKAQNVVEFYLEQISKAKGKDYYPKNTTENLSNFFVSYEEFISLSKREEELFQLVIDSESLENELIELRSQRVKILNLIQHLEPFVVVDDKFNEFKDTKNTKVYLGSCKLESVMAIREVVDKRQLTQLKVFNGLKNAVILVVSHNQEAEDLINEITEFGFNRCTFDFEANAKVKIAELNNQLVSIDEKEEKIFKIVCQSIENVKKLKLLCDYYYFLLEKENVSEKFRRTESTFVLEGYVPKEKQEEITNTLFEISNAIFVEYTEIPKDEEAPVLLKNNKMVRQSEFVTDLYSTPNYREIDPNKVVFFFFMLFMGVIMADIGYGVLMVVFGFILSSRIKVDNGAKRLWNVIAIGGVFAIIFGVLFNSFFGISVFPFTVIPSPVNLMTGEIYPETIMILLLASLGLGVFQLSVGYFCKALNCFKSGDIIDGILDGILWALFLIGLVFATFNFLMDYLNVGISNEMRAFFGKTTKPGLIVVISTVVLAALTAGRHERGFGKFSKGFGAVYGIINILSDVLSYARLFGLMLSGMIIAQTFNYKLGLPIMENGGIGIVLGGLIIVVGHVFNIAMNVLGAYIHDSRLQYIEFFSKFYTGEGGKFKPLASDFEYIYLKK